MDRRKFLMIAGGGVVVAAGAGAAGFAMTREPSRALSPWRHAGSLYTEPRRKALSFAILAPNPHNRQPWLVDLVGDNRAVLYRDADRSLPETDPHDRQITIGLGCFLEILRQAAAEDGFDLRIDPFPEGFDDQALDHRPVANIEFRRGAEVEKDPLFAHVLDRRSLKDPYDTGKPVTSSVLRQLEAAIGDGVDVAGTNEVGAVKRLRELTHEALRVEFTTPAKFRESVDLMRFGKAEIEADPDGIDLGGPVLESLMVLGLLSREAMLEPGSSSQQAGFDMIREQTQTAQAFLWLTTTSNTRLDQFNAGKSWVRINLAATAAGLGVHPLSQALQEYPEIRHLHRKIHETLAPGGGTIQMLGRLGYAERVPPSPRWGLDDKIRGG